MKSGLSIFSLTLIGNAGIIRLFIYEERIVLAEIICPHCQNPIYDEEALLCHFCGNSLRRKTQGVLSQLRYGVPLVWWGVVFIVLVALLGYFVF